MAGAIWKAVDMMLQIIVNIIAKVISEVARLLGKFKEKVEDIAVERAADVSVDTGTSYLVWRSDMQLLARNFKALSSRASDLEETVERAELSGRQKGKSEVKNWLEDVGKLENDFIALQRRVQQEKFWKLFLVGGHARKMQDQVVQFTEQSRHFDGLLLENLNNKINDKIALSSRASDLEETVERAELSGRQKGKSEVKNWLEDVGKLENDFIALQRRVQQEKFWKLFLVGGHARKMQDQVVQFTEQSRHFDGLLLENQQNLENHS
nr:uncharacterized protein LOC113687444 [Coffea arabica]